MFAPYPTAASPALSSCTRSDASLQSEPFTITMDPDGRCSVGGRNIIFIACLNWKIFSTRNKLDQEECWLRMRVILSWLDNVLITMNAENVC